MADIQTIAQQASLRGSPDRVGLRLFCLIVHHLLLCYLRQERFYGSARTLRMSQYKLGVSIDFVANQDDNPARHVHAYFRRRTDIGCTTDRRKTWSESYQDLVLRRFSQPLHSPYHLRR